MAWKKYSIAVDFDGVIHQYTTKQQGEWDPEYIPDPPMPGAFEWLTQMVRHFKVVIYSARLTPRDNTEAGWAAAIDARDAVTSWMMKHGLQVEVIRSLEFWQSAGKPTALIYIDDRGFRFEGTFPTKEQIHRLRPWKVNGGPSWKVPDGEE